MKVMLIHNPNAGDDTRPTSGQFEALIREAGHQVRLQSIKEKGWSASIRKNADLVAVAGGDGTVGRVARRLVGRGIPIAVVPAGTANNIGKSLGIAGKSVTQLIPGWATARRLEFDVGIATGPWGSRRFIEGLGLGLFARALPKIRRNKTMANLTEREVKIAYALQLIGERLEDSAPMRLRAALGGTDISGKYLLLEAMNTCYIGPNLFLAPYVTHGAGLFDIVSVTEKDRKKLAKYLASWQEGKLWPPDLGVSRGNRLEIEWTGFPLHIDDKVWPETGEPRPKPPAMIKIELERAVLEFLVPEQVGASVNERRSKTPKGKSRKGLEAKKKAPQKRP